MALVRKYASAPKPEKDALRKSQAITDPAAPDTAFQENLQIDSQQPAYTLSRQNLIALQHRVGNQAVMRMLQSKEGAGRVVPAIRPSGFMPSRAEARLSHSGGPAVQPTMLIRSAQRSTLQAARPRFFGKRKTEQEVAGDISGVKDTAPGSNWQGDDHKPGARDWGDQARTAATGINEAGGMMSYAGSTIVGGLNAETDKGGSMVGKDAREGVGMAGTATGLVSSGMGSVTSLINMAVTIKQMASPGAFENKEVFTNLFLDASSQGKGVLSGIGSAVTGIGSAIASKISNDSKDSAASVSSHFDGVRSALGAFGSVFDGVVSLARLGKNVVFGLISIFGKDNKSVLSVIKERGEAIFTDALQVFKSILGAANGAISAAKIFLEIAGKAADFISTVPIIGAAINIAMKCIDILLEVVKIISRGIRIGKASINYYRMNKLEKEQDRHVINPSINKLVEINKKRIKRSMIPVVGGMSRILADVIGIGASVLNIVGVATSPAYGAGVGIMAAGYALTGTSVGMKVATSGTEKGFSAARFIKQKGRNLAANSTQHSKIAKLNTLDGRRIFNTDKSTENKTQKYIEVVQNLFSTVAGLQTYSPASAPEYKKTLMMLEATGVSKQKLFAHNGNPKEQAKLLIKALRSRE